MEVINCRLEKLVQNDPEKQEKIYGFRLTKNYQYCELFAEDFDSFQKWFENLKQFCVLTTFFEDYTTLDVLGKGNFARVYIAKNNQTQQPFAVKVFEKDKFLSLDLDRLALIKEIGILRHINHQNILKIYEIYENETYIFVVSELLRGGELYQKLKSQESYSERVARQVMYNLLQAVNYLHQKNIMHRDIKPENLILRSKNNDQDICIADFGLADYHNPEGKYLFQRCGTPGYVAPEILADKEYDFKVDVFSLGIILFTMLTGYPPFQSDDYDRLVQLNYNCNINFNDPAIKQNLSVESIDLLNKMLQKEPNRRISSKDALEHKWFSNLNNIQLRQLRLNGSMISNQRQVLTRKPDQKETDNLRSRTPLMNKRISVFTQSMSPFNSKGEGQEKITIQKFTFDIEDKKESDLNTSNTKTLRNESQNLEEKKQNN